MFCAFWHFFEIKKNLLRALQEYERLCGAHYLQAECGILVVTAGAIEKILIEAAVVNLAIKQTYRKVLPFHLRKASEPPWGFVNTMNQLAPKHPEGIGTFALALFLTPLLGCLDGLTRPRLTRNT